MTITNIVNLRNSPSLLDIPKQLRALADRVESGEQPVECCMALIIEPDNFEPSFWGWGKVPDRYGIAGIFTLAAKLVLTDSD